MILRDVIDALLDGSGTVDDYRADFERFARLARLQATPDADLPRLAAAFERARGAHAAASSRLQRGDAARDWAFAVEAAMDLLWLGDAAAAEDVLRDAVVPDGMRGWAALPALQAARLRGDWARTQALLQDARASARGKPELEALLAMEGAIAQAFVERRPHILVRAWRELGATLPSAFGMELFVLAALVETPAAIDRAATPARRELLLRYELDRSTRRFMAEAVAALSDDGAKPALLADVRAGVLEAADAAPTATLRAALHELSRRLALRLGLDAPTTAASTPWILALQALPFTALAAPSSSFAVPSSFPSRTVRLSWLASRVAGSLIKNRVLRGVASKGKVPELQKREQAQLIKLLTRHLGELKGPFMKLGQQISGPILEALPPDVAADLQRLYDQTPTMAPARVRAVIEGELDRALEDAFQSFDLQPFGAGSVGQVHAATLPDGTPVAVKVQFEGIADAARIDLNHLRRATPLLRRAFPRANVDEIIDEWAAMLASEVDYRKERASMASFTTLWRPFPALVVPRVHTTHSADRLITMDLFRGQRLADFAATASQDERNRVAREILRSTWHAIVQGGLFNVDPHPGNYVILDGRLGCLDFGRVKHWSPAFVRDWTALIGAAVRDDFAAFREVHARLGFAGDKSFDVRVAFYTFKQTEAAPYVAPRFAFRQGFVRGAFRAGVIENANLLHYRLPRDYVMATRMHWGLFHILELLRAEGAWWDDVAEFMTGAVNFRVTA